MTLGMDASPVFSEMCRASFTNDEIMKSKSSLSARLKKSHEGSDDESYSESGFNSFSILYRGYKKIYPVVIKMAHMLIKDREGDGTNRNNNFFDPKHSES